MSPISSSSNPAIAWSLAGWLWGSRNDGDAHDNPARRPLRRAPREGTEGAHNVAASSPDDTALVARLQAGDDTALAEVVDRYAQNVIAIAFQYLRTRDLAEDVAQRVFIRLWERRETLGAVANLAQYLRGAARNAAIDTIRRAHAASRLEESLLSEQHIMQTHATNSGIQAVEASEFAEQVRQVLSTLSPRVREVALLYFERDLEPGEIATLLGVAPRTVYNQLRTAIQAFAKAFGHRE